jgi:transcription factor STE12
LPSKSAQCPKLSRSTANAGTFYRHRRTHEQQQNGEPIDSFSEEDLDNDADQLVSLEEESPEPGAEQAYFTSAMGHGHSNSLDLGPAMGSMNTGTPVNAAMNGTSMAPPQMIAAHNY